MSFKVPGTQQSSAAEDADQVEVDRFQTVGVDGGDDRVVQELVRVLLHLDGESHFLCQLVRFDLPIMFCVVPLVFRRLWQMFFIFEQLHNS